MPIANKAEAIMARIRIGIGIEISLGMKKSIIPIIMNAIPAINDIAILLFCVSKLLFL
jgi:hypothetical protein